MFTYSLFFFTGTDISHLRFQIDIIHIKLSWLEVQNLISYHSNLVWNLWPACCCKQ